MRSHFCKISWEVRSCTSSDTKNVSLKNPEMNPVLTRLRCMEGVLLALTESVISAGQSLASTGLLGKSHTQIPERKWTDCPVPCLLRMVFFVLHKLTSLGCDWFCSCIWRSVWWPQKNQGSIRVPPQAKTCLVGLLPLSLKTKDSPCKKQS